MSPAELCRQVASAKSKKEIIADVEALLGERFINSGKPWIEIARNLVGTENGDCVFALLTAEAMMRKFDAQ